MTSRFARTGVLAAAAVAAARDRRHRRAGGGVERWHRRRDRRVRIDHGAHQPHRPRRHRVRRLPADQFQAKIYPNVDVKFEAITDYEGEVKIRMNTENYGDVLLIPNAVTADQLPDVLRPARHGRRPAARSTASSTEQAYDGKVYGIANIGNANGFVYNKAVWAEGRRHRGADHARRSSSPTSRRSRPRPTPIPLLHQLQGRLAADPLGGQPRRRSAATPTRSTKLAHDRRPVGRGHRPQRHRHACSTTSCTTS